MGPVSSPPIVNGAMAGSVGSIIAMGIGPVGLSTLGVVRIRMGPSGATFCTGSTLEKSGRAAGCVTSSTKSASNKPPPTMSIGVGRAIFSAACTSA
ncbi:unannotated protein [freshwater metagenome]|uniref:Unannotated protein n=1 Tax=freshwater metagenome TaxID=449393 RepID=A0A6J6M4R9_9ZZZZ